jgi:hypothetical protein
MKLFLSQTRSLTSENEADKQSAILEIFANYLRAPARNVVSIVNLSEADQKSLKTTVSKKFYCFNHFLS